MLFLYIRLLRLFRCTSVPSQGGAFWYIFQIWQQLPQLSRAYYAHFIQRRQRRFKAVCSVGLEVYTDAIKPPYRANHKATKSKQARTAACQVYIIHFNLLKFFINFSGQIRTKSGAKIEILCN